MKKKIQLERLERDMQVFGIIEDEVYTICEMKISAKDLMRGTEVDMPMRPGENSTSFAIKYGKLKVLKGAVKTIERFWPLMVVEENGSAVLWKKGKQDEAIDFLKDMGYEIVAKTKQDYIMEKKNG